jgi:hypothetical protein
MIRPQRPLTLDAVPRDLIEGIAPAASYRCDVPGIELVPLGLVRGPKARKLHRETLESLADGLRCAANIPPVIAYMNGEHADILDGTHRWRISCAAGFTHLPCQLIPLWEAEAGFRYDPTANSRETCL